jgi:hypothetical protein
MRLVLTAAAATLTLTTSLIAQGSSAAAPAAARPALVVLPAEQQIAAALLPLPDSLRPGTRVWGYSPEGRFVELRPGSGSMTCIADDPGDNAAGTRGNRFHVACYASTMEPFMARGRELRAQGKDEISVDTLRKADVRDGRIHLPSAAMLYSLTGQYSNYNPATNTITGARPLFVVYVPFATGPQLGLSAIPSRGTPWIMHPGEAGAHIMFTPGM